MPDEDQSSSPGGAASAVPTPPYGWGRYSLIKCARHVTSPLRMARRVQMQRWRRDTKSLRRCIPICPEHQVGAWQRR
jgi:hypothetical protein